MSKRIEQTRRPRHPPEMRCIFLLTRKRGNTGWRVGIHRNNPSRDFQRFFSDQAHGGSEAALAAAQAWRDEIEAAYPRSTKHDLASLMRKHNTSGVPGVFRRTMRRKAKNGGIRTHFVWQAQTPRSVVPYRSRSFSVKKFGEEEAKRLAIEARKAFEAELI